MGDELDHGVHADGRSSRRSTRLNAAAEVTDRSRVLELRQYTLHPGTRDTLIDIFDREFVETQEAVGISVLAQFRDLDRPDVFTWLRGFPDMESRAASLAAFYDGPVWAAHRDAANATMISFDNVRLLHPVAPAVGIRLGARAAGGVRTGDPGLVVATIYTLNPAAAPAFAGVFERVVAPRLLAAGGALIASFATEHAPNTFPRLPIREGEDAFVSLARFRDAADHARHLARLAADPAWGAVQRELAARDYATAPERWRLVPTARSHTFR